MINLLQVHEYNQVYEDLLFSQLGINNQECFYLPPESSSFSFLSNNKSFLTKITVMSELNKSTARQIVNF